jgi:hypothetical protein
MAYAPAQSPSRPQRQVLTSSGDAESSAAFRAPHQPADRPGPSLSVEVFQAHFGTRPILLVWKRHFRHVCTFNVSMARMMSGTAMRSPV